MTGRSIEPLLQSNKAAWREEAFFEHNYMRDGGIPASEAVRVDNVRLKGWKYIPYIDANPVIEELYDLNSDPEEVKNIAPDPRYQKDLVRLRTRWESWFNSFKEWDTRPDYTWQDPD
jgi:arylsulfatase A-like enzyme